MNAKKIIQRSQQAMRTRDVLNISNCGIYSILYCPSSVVERLRRRLCKYEIAGSNPASDHFDIAYSLQKGDLSWILSASELKLLSFTVVL